MHTHHDIHSLVIKSGRKGSAKQGIYSMWEQKEAILFLSELAHNINLWTNDKVIIYTYFGSFELSAPAVMNKHTLAGESILEGVAVKFLFGLLPPKKFYFN